MLRKLLVIAGFVALCAPTASAQLADAATFAGPVAARGAALSPNGNFVAYIRRNDQGEQVIVLDRAANQLRAVQSLPDGRGSFLWAVWKGDNRLVAGIRIAMVAEGRIATGSHRRADNVEYSVMRVVAFNRDGSGFVPLFEGQTRQLVYGYGSVYLLDALHGDPENVLVSAWNNDGHGIWRANVNNGRVERVFNGTFDTIGYAVDGEGNPVMRRDRLPNGAGFRFFRRGTNGEWTQIAEQRRGFLIDDSPDFDAAAAGPAANQVYVIARQPGQDRNAVYLYDTATGAFGEPLFAGTESDVTGVRVDPDTGELLLTCEFGQRRRCTSRDAQVQRHMRGLDGFFGGAATVSLVNMSSDRNTWLIYAEGPTDAAGYYIYDRSAGRVDAIAMLYPRVNPASLSPTSVVNYQATDGTTLWAYVTAPPGEGRRPMVVMPHGGPEARDRYGYDAFAQFLASRGYVVVQPNFRGSGGFGRAFVEAGNGQWGRRMQSDVSDAVRHMIETGVADPQRVCIVGTSYGGYAALAGATLTPELYRCAVSIAGVSDLTRILRTERLQNGRGSDVYAYWQRTIRSGVTEDGGLDAVSPARLASNVRAPILLLHGEDDETVLIEQSEIMDRALRDAGKNVRFVRIPGSDHYWDTWDDESRLTLYRETEAFLAQHLGPAN